MTIHETRLNTLRQKLAPLQADAVLSLANADNQYLTGFLGDTSAVIVTEQEAVFVCDPRFTEEAGVEVQAFAIEEVRGSFMTRVGERLSKTGAKTTLFDPVYTTVAQHDAIQKTYGGTLKPEPDVVAALRIRKSPDEIGLLREASALAEGAVTDLVKTIRAGITERDLAAQIEFEFKRRGAAGPSFDTIALFGARSSLPHGQPGDTALKSGDVVLLDFGCRRNGYCSDLTRTYAFDRMPGAWFEEIYGITLAAQQAAIKAIRPGMKCLEADAVARQRIADAGFGPQFGHGLGHGVGIEIHENPRLTFESETILEKNMIITIEPGIYLPGKGGVRIEDLAVVTENGCELLSRMPKELKVLK